MKKFSIYLIVFLSIAVSWNSCEKESKELIYNGESYNTTNGLNNSETLLYDDRDSNVYVVVQIENQLWMAENLRYDFLDSKLNPGNPNSKYGRLYNFSMKKSEGQTKVP